MKIYGKDTINLRDFVIFNNKNDYELVSSKLYIRGPHIISLLSFIDFKEGFTNNGLLYVNKKGEVSTLDRDSLLKFHRLRDDYKELISSYENIKKDLVKIVPLFLINDIFGRFSYTLFNNHFVIHTNIFDFLLVVFDIPYYFFYEKEDICFVLDTGVQSPEHLPIAIVRSSKNVAREVVKEFYYLFGGDK